MKKTKTRGFLAGVVVLAIVCTVLAVGILGTSTALQSYSTQLESVYKSSFYELVTNVNEIETKLNKAILSTSSSQQEKLLEDVYDNCTLAVSNMNRLPLEHETLFETTKFLNQMGGYSYVLINNLGSRALNESEINKLNELHTTSLYIKEIITDFVNNMDNNYSIIKTARVSKKIDNNFNTLFTSFKANDADYPSLIYDGPFSDSTTNKEVKGLNKETISSDVALEKVKTWFKNGTNYQLVSENAGKIETYNVTFTTDTGRNGFVQVTKKGGLLLSFNCYSKQVKDELELKDCEQKAEEFAVTLGLENMKAVWGAKLNGVAYVNLTPVVNNVIIYPDMIKAKVNCSNGEILGWESQAFVYNHTDRSGLKATITQKKKKKSVNSLFEIQETKLTLIPLEYNREVLAFEYHCTYNENEYYVYIDAKTGEQVNILKVISRIDGNRMM